MAGRPPEVDHVKQAFLSEIGAAEDLVLQILQFKGGINPKGPKGLHPKYVRQVIELAFMGVVSSWEEFLELTLVRYMAGAKTKSGYTVTPKFGRANSLQHAYQVLSGNPKFNPLKDYLKVSDPKWVANSAEFYFSQHGYSEVKSRSELISHASAIRNRVAHSSEKCRHDFRNTALHFLNPASGNLNRGYGPGDLLMENAIRHFSPEIIQGGGTIFSAFMRLYTSLAQKIVP